MTHGLCQLTILWNASQQNSLAEILSLSLLSSQKHFYPEQSGLSAA
jgi:hypothetical protein